MKISKPNIPLKSYADYDVFKLYLLDVGLLNAMADVDVQVLLNKNQMMTEQFVCHDVFYWTAENATAEVDFIIQKANDIIPIEVKAEENLKSKSLKVLSW
jgi:predicted AAA+ superfamily ATPase